MQQDEFRLALYDYITNMTSMKPSDVIDIEMLGDSLAFKLINGKSLFLKFIEEDDTDKEMDYETDE